MSRVAAAPAHHSRLAWARADRRGCRRPRPPRRGVPARRGEATVPAPFGSWATPVTSAVVVAAAVRLGEVRVDGDDVVWAEGRPAEGGRTQLVRRRADGTHGRPAAGGRERAHRRPRVRRGRLVGARRGRLVHRLGRPAAVPARARRRPRPADPGARAPPRRPLRRRRGEPRRHTDRLRPGAPPRRAGHGRPQRGRHPRRPPARSTPEVLVTGPDFVAAPRLSPDGGTLAWLQWNHPAMPWDAAQLVVRDLATGRRPSSRAARGSR